LSSQVPDNMDAEKAGNLYRLVSMGMAPEDVRTMAGEPERLSIGRERMCWTYHAGRLVIIFTVESGRTAVSKVILRCLPRVEGSA